MKFTKRQREVLDSLASATKAKPESVVGNDHAVAFNLVKAGVLNVVRTEDKYGTEREMFWIRGEREAIAPFDDSHTFMVYGSFHFVDSEENFFYLKTPSGAPWKGVVAAIKRLIRKLSTRELHIEDAYWNLDGLTKSMWHHKPDKHRRFEYVNGDFREVKK